MSELLSVVLPTHDRAGELRRAADSVLGQEVEALELVVVDDASTDDTPAVLARLAEEDHRVKVVTTNGPLGPCAARNAGLAVAEGELVGFCDDDDAWAPGAAQAVLGRLAEDPALGMVSGWHTVSHAGTGRSAVFRGPLRYGARQLLWQNVVGVPFGVLRRTRLSFDVGFDPDLPTGEDWDLWLRCARERPVASVPRSCYVYTQHGGDRVTAGLARQAEGRRNFLAKHGGEMSGACRLFHRAVLAGYDGGRRGMGRCLAEGARRAPADAAVAGLLLGMSTTASRWGVRRGDPGLQARVVTSALSRVGGGGRG